MVPFLLSIVTISSEFGSVVKVIKVNVKCCHFNDVGVSHAQMAVPLTQLRDAPGVTHVRLLLEAINTQFGIHRIYNSLCVCFVHACFLI